MCIGSGAFLSSSHRHMVGEFISKEFQKLLKDVCAFPTTSAPYTPKANGIIERGIQTLKDEVTRVLTHAGMPVVYWHLAMQDAALRHRVRTLFRRMHPGMQWRFVDIIRRVLGLELKLGCLWNV